MLVDEDRAIDADKAKGDVGPIIAVPGDDEVFRPQTETEQQDVPEMLAATGLPRPLDDRVVAVAEVVDIGVAMHLAFQAIIAGAADQHVVSVTGADRIVAKQSDQGLASRISPYGIRSVRQA